MAYTPHGGGCCGYRHIYNVDRMSVEELDRVLAEHFQAGNNNRIVEIILSSRQVVSPPPAHDDRFHDSVRAAGGWPVVLAARGFKLAAVWRNSNSGNFCYQFLKTTEFHTGPLPFPWTGETVTLREPPVVTRVVADIAEQYRVGQTVRKVRGNIDVGRIGAIDEVEGERIRVRWRNSGDRSNWFNRDTFEVIELVVGGGEEPARVDPNLPVAIRNLTTGEVTPAVIFGAVRDGARSATALATVVPTTITSGGRRANESYAYNLDTGSWAGDNQNNIFRLFNVRTPPVVVEPVPAPAPAPAPEAPRVVLTEFFAAFRNGTIRGPFETMEAVRESYPRVRTIRRRDIMSDGRVNHIDRQFIAGEE